MSSLVSNDPVMYESEDSTEEVWIVEEYEQDQVGQAGEHRHNDDVVVVEDVPPDHDHVRVREVPLKGEGGHVDNEVEGVETNHEMPDGGGGVADRTIDAEDVGVHYVESWKSRKFQNLPLVIVFGAPLFGNATASVGGVFSQA